MQNMISETCNFWYVAILSLSWSYKIYLLLADTAQIHFAIGLKEKKSCNFFQTNEYKNIIFFQDMNINQFQQLF